VYGQLELELVCYRLYVLLLGLECLPSCVLIKPPGVVDLLHNRKHLGHFFPVHIESILEEQLLHLIHTDRPATICVQRGKHLGDLPISVDV